MSLSSSSIYCNLVPLSPSIIIQKDSYIFLNKYYFKYIIHFSFLLKENHAQLFPTVKLSYTNQPPLSSSPFLVRESLLIWKHGNLSLWHRHSRGWKMSEDSIKPRSHGYPSNCYASASSCVLYNQFRRCRRCGVKGPKYLCLAFNGKFASFDQKTSRCRESTLSISAIAFP